MATAERKQKFPVFVSSTYEDLVPYREATQRVLIRLEQTIKGMEYFGASAKKPLSVCLQTVRECKIYIGIIGMRYGSVDDETGKSFTQLEYEEAIKNKIPTLIYIIDDDCPVLPRYVDTDERARKLADFKAILKAEHTVSFFTSPEDFSTKLTQDIVALLNEMGHTEETKSIGRDIQTDFEEIFKKFLFRPAKYHGQEGTLTVKIGSEDKCCATIKTNITTELGMTQGDAVNVVVYVLNPKTGIPLHREKIYMYGEKECGDWIEAVPADTIVNVKVRLNYLVTPEIKSYDGGSMVVNVKYKNFILLAVPQ